MSHSHHFHRLRSTWTRARRQNPMGLPAAIASLGLVVTIFLAAGVGFLTSLARSLPDDEALGRIGQMAQSTTVYDRMDRVAFTLHREQRTDVSLLEVSHHLIGAILAIEDQRFYEHHGFDPRRMIGAALANLRAGRAVQGGSTITQQLARQGFLSLDKTYRRKLQEIILAARLERRYSKDEILEFYLNKVYFGDGFYGAEVAARGYFGKSASDLTVGEAATLAGLVKSPSSYAPTVDIDKATERRDVVLRAMFETGAIDLETWEVERDAPVQLSDTLRIDKGYAQYFKEEVRQQLVGLFGVDRVLEGGLRVYSTIDPAMQRAAEMAVATGLEKIDARRAAAARRLGREARGAGEDPLQAALIAIEPGTGHVRAMVGGRDFGDSKFNRAVQAHRQPGSAFKPFVYAAALEAGYTPATIIRDLDVPVDTLQGEWTPDDGHSEAQSLSLRAALTMSSNRAAVRLLQEVGIPQTVQFAKGMGVGDVPSVPSLALGSGEVTLQALTAAYAAFINRGNVPTPILIRRVTDTEGQVLFEAEVTTTPAVSETTAFLMTTMLADVINAGTGYGARRAGFTLPAAGKTGTTNDYRDAWFVGFTPHLATGVWFGFDQPRTILANGFAGDVAVPVWADFMKAATREDEPTWVVPPDRVTVTRVCRLSGLLATEGCEHVDVVTEDGEIERRSMSYLEYFAPGTEPTGACDLHPTRGFFGSLAAAFTGGDPPAPPRLADAGLPEQEAEVAALVAPLGEGQEPTSPPKKKRGFWSRVFGIGRH